MNNKLLTIGLITIFLIVILSGCEESSNSNDSPVDIDPEWIETVITVKVESLYLYDNVVTQNAGANVRIQVLREEKEELNVVKPTDSIGIASEVLGFTLFDFQKVTVAATLVDKPDITMTNTIDLWDIKNSGILLDGTYYYEEYVTLPYFDG